MLANNPPTTPIRLCKAKHEEYTLVWAGLLVWTSGLILSTVGLYRHSWGLYSWGSHLAGYDTAITHARTHNPKVSRA